MAGWNEQINAPLIAQNSAVPLDDMYQQTYNSMDPSLKKYLNEDYVQGNKKKLIDILVGQGRVEDPRTSQLRRTLTKQANDFNPEEYVNKNYNPAAETANALARQGIQKTNQNYSSRGLLYSGHRAAAEAGINANKAASLADEKAQLGMEANNMKNSMTTAAANVGLAGYQSDIDRANQTYENAQQNELQRRQGMQQLGAGLGYGAGALAAHYAKPTPGLTGGTGGVSPTAAYSAYSQPGLLGTYNYGSY